MRGSMAEDARVRVQMRERGLDASVGETFFFVVILVSLTIRGILADADIEGLEDGVGNTMRAQGGPPGELRLCSNS